MVEILHQCEAGGRQTRHCVEHRVDGAPVVAGEDERDRTDQGHDQPREGHDDHAVAPIEAIILWPQPETDLTEEREHADHQKERGQRMPLSAEYRPGQGEKARERHDREDPAEGERNDPEIIASRANQHVTRPPARWRRTRWPCQPARPR